MVMRAQMVLPCEATSVSAARRFVREQLADWGFGAMADTAALLVSELVTNVILHAHTPVRVALLGDDERIRVEVGDGSEVEPLRRDTSELDATGRGLMLIEAMASDWGVANTAEGKIVWFEVHREPAAEADPAEAASRVR